jgi:predicted transcriptional regulator of viral defense system
MKFNRLLEIVGNEPLFETGFLLAGNVDPKNIRRQLSRWVKTGHLYQLRRGVYALAPPYQKTVPHPYLVANRLVRASYVSCQSALAYYNLIPEYVPIVTSITTNRPGHWNTPLGSYQFHHVKVSLLQGYRQIGLGGNQTAFIATPEKALLDLIYLQPGGDSPDYLNQLRLQNLDQLDLNQAHAHTPKLQRAVSYIMELANTEAMEYEDL